MWVLAKGDRLAGWVFMGGIPVTLMGTMSVGTAWAACLILSSGVGRGTALFHTICPSTSNISPLSPQRSCNLSESWDLSSSIEDAKDCKTKGTTEIEREISSLWTTNSELSKEKPADKTVHVQKCALFNSDSSALQQAVNKRKQKIIYVFRMSKQK